MAHKLVFMGNMEQSFFYCVSNASCRYYVCLASTVKRVSAKTFGSSSKERKMKYSLWEIKDELRDWLVLTRKSGANNRSYCDEWYSRRFVDEF